MNNDTLKTYEYLWTQRDKYCLGPVNDGYRFIEKWENLYGIYQIDILHYLPLIIGETYSIREQIIAKMKEADCIFITQNDLINKSDIKRLWGDRKDEFVIKRRKQFNSENKWDEEVICHKSSYRAIRTGLPESQHNQLKKKMIDAGVEVVEEDMIVLRRKHGSNNDFDIIYQPENKIICEEYPHNKRTEMVQKLLDGGIKIID